MADKNRFAVYRALSRHVETDKSWTAELADPDTADKKISDSIILTFLKTHFTEKSPDHCLSDFKLWVAQNTQRISPIVRNAVNTAANVQRARYKRKQELANKLLLSTKNATVKAAIKKLRALISSHIVKQKIDPYPPPKHWIVENQAIWDLWNYHISEAKQSDPRITRKAMHLIDETKLDYDLGCDESAMFFDESGELVAMVISDFCKSEEILHWANEIVQWNVDLKKNIRVSNSSV